MSRLETLTNPMSNGGAVVDAEGPTMQHINEAFREYAERGSKRAAAELDIFPLVKADLDARDKLGWQSYGRPMTTHDGRDSLRDAYEEALDLCCYLRKAIAERDGR